MPFSNQFGLSNNIDLTASPNQLPGDVYLRLREQLDTNPEDKNWRALIRVAEHNYRIRPEVRESWSSAINRTHSAADCLLTELGSLGITVEELCGYLDKLRIDTCLLGLHPYEDIKITQDVETSVEAYEGRSLELEVKATGRPYPRYQWFFCKNGDEIFTRLTGRIESRLRLDNLSVENAGAYACQIHNSDDKDKCRISKNCLVCVVPDPHPPDYGPGTGLNPPEKSDISNILRNLGQPEPAPVSPLSNVWKPGSFKGLERSSTTENLIVRHPYDLTVGVNESFVLSVETRGDPPIVYQWYRNCVPLPEYGPRLEVQHAMLEDFGTYACLVKDGRTSQMSRQASVTEYAVVPFPDDKIIMVSHPKSCHVKFGGDALFHCEAKCSQPLHYQWFRDGVPIKGATESELKFYNIQDRMREGTYQCEISTETSTERRLTFAAHLAVEVPQNVRENIEYNPSDKVALLIGNYEYRSEQPLTAPKTDVQVLQEIFRSLDFKVVSLLNLTKPEIESAVIEFCNLLDKNVYAVVYLCGHGFEEEGYSFLVPTDAPTGYKRDECVCADVIVENMQKKEPALIFMIMDICRKRNKVKGTGVPLNLERKSGGNTVFCYATSINMNAFEYKNSGLLVQHLQSLLKKPVGIDALVSELKEEFNRIPMHRDIQNPELRSNILAPQRSLTDKISTKGQTEAFQLRRLWWMNAHLKPECKFVDIPSLGVKIELDFQAYFSNVLQVYAIVKRRGITEQCCPYICSWPPTVSVMREPMTVAENPCKTKVTFLDIQKLQSDLVVNLKVDYKHEGHCSSVITKVNLGLPLVARLRLWRDQPNFTPMHREGIEQTEESGEYSM